MAGNNLLKKSHTCPGVFIGASIGASKIKNHYVATLLIITY